MSAKKTLDALRQEIDAIDRAVHDLLMRRTQVVEEVRAVKGNDGAKLRPGREATILRSLIARHAGPLPKAVVVRLWREIFSAFVRLQGPFSVSVFEPEGSCGFGDLARGQYGGFTPMKAHHSARRVIEEVRRGDAVVGVLPIPGRDDAEPWWPSLASREPRTPRVIARLPFAPGGNGRGGRLEALAIAGVPVEPTGRDHTYLVIDADEEFTPTGLVAVLKSAKLPVLFTLAANHRDAPRTWLYLAEIDDFVAADDPRLAAVVEASTKPIRRAIPIGSFAVPLAVSDLAETPWPAIRKASGRKSVARRAATKRGER